MSQQYAYHGAERKKTIEAGELLAAILIPSGTRASTSFGEMALSAGRGSVIVGEQGIAGILDLRNRTLYDFQSGSTQARAAFAGIYGALAREMAFSHVKVGSTFSAFRKGDGDMMRLIQSYDVPEEIHSAVKGLRSPVAGLVRVGAAPEADAAAFCLPEELTRGFNEKANESFKLSGSLPERLVMPVKWDVLREELQDMDSQERLSAMEIKWRRHRWLEKEAPPQAEAPSGLDIYSDIIWC